MLGIVAGNQVILDKVAGILNGTDLAVESYGELILLLRKDLGFSVPENLEGQKLILRSPFPREKTEVQKRGN